MAYNLGYVGTAYNLGYSGTYTGGGVTYPYQLTSHGAADPNSIMANANFATTGTVELRIVSDFDSAKMVVDWQAMSDSQLWRDDINTLNTHHIAVSSAEFVSTRRWRVITIVVGECGDGVPTGQQLTDRETSRLRYGF